MTRNALALFEGACYGVFRIVRARLHASDRSILVNASKSLIRHLLKIERQSMSPRSVLRTWGRESRTPLHHEILFHQDKRTRKENIEEHNGERTHNFILFVYGRAFTVYYRIQTSSLTR